MKSFSLANLMAASVTAGCVAALMYPRPVMAQEAHVSEPQVQGPQWKTAYFKRGSVGMYKTEWGSGPDGTLRVRIPITLSGTQARVYVQSSWDADVTFSKMSLAKGADDKGTIVGPSIPVTFDGQRSGEIKGRGPDRVSDPIPAAITPGTWYLQTSYTSPQYSYFYDKDGFFAEAGDKHDAEKMAPKKPGAYPGNAFRIDVLTTDTRPAILCYGDSITQGYSSTPNSPTRYPDVLAKLLDRPTLNLGVNGDLITYAGNHGFRQLRGVKSVILLMGINDIISGKITTVEDYFKSASRFATQCRAAGQKVYIGTITPATGLPNFDKSPAKEALRQAINEKLRTYTGCDGIIDFDKALLDPDNPSKLLPAYQADWVHLSDAGYQKMAETAADVLRQEK